MNPHCLLNLGLIAQKYNAINVEINVDS